MNMRMQAVVFDLDGTLLDSWPTLPMPAIRSSQPTGFPYTPSTPIGCSWVTGCGD